MSNGQPNHRTVCKRVLPLHQSFSKRTATDNQPPIPISVSYTHLSEKFCCFQFTQVPSVPLSVPAGLNLATMIAVVVALRFCIASLKGPAAGWPPRATTAVSTSTGRATRSPTPSTPARGAAPCRAYNRLKKRKARGKISTDEWNALVARAQEIREQAQRGCLSDFEMKKAFGEI